MAGRCCRLSGASSSVCCAPEQAPCCAVCRAPPQDIPGIEGAKGEAGAARRGRCQVTLLQGSAARSREAKARGVSDRGA